MGTVNGKIICTEAYKTDDGAEKERKITIDSPEDLMKFLGWTLRDLENFGFVADCTPFANE